MTTHSLKYTTRITPTVPIPINIRDNSANPSVNLSVEYNDTHATVCSKTFKNTDECQDYIEKYDTGDISQDLINALKPHEANYDDAENKIAWLYDEYKHDEALLDYLLDEDGADLEPDEIAPMMADHYRGVYNSEEDFIEMLVKEDYFGGDTDSFLHNYIDYDKLARDLFINDYDACDVDGMCHVFEKF